MFPSESFATAAGNSLSMNSDLSAIVELASISQNFATYVASSRQLALLRVRHLGAALASALKPL